MLWLVRTISRSVSAGVLAVVLEPLLCRLREALFKGRRCLVAACILLEFAVP